MIIIAKIRELLIFFLFLHFHFDENAHGEKIRLVHMKSFVRIASLSSHAEISHHILILYSLEYRGEKTLIHRTSVSGNIHCMHTHTHTHTRAHTHTHTHRWLRSCLQETVN